MAKKELVIWDSEAVFSETWEKEIKEENPTFSDDEIFEELNFLNGIYLEDERANLDIMLNGNIIVIADLGLWNGRRCGYKEIGNNIADCLYSECDYNKWYVDGKKNLCCVVSHHDGTNYYTYRELKENLSDIQIENFKDKLYCGTVTSADISRYTKSVGKQILQIYGVA